MALDILNETEKNCLENTDLNAIDSSTCTDKLKHEMKCQRVRFVDDEAITDRFVSRDEVDAAPGVKKLHILKNKSSSETSILLRTHSLTKCPERHLSLNSTLLRNGDNLNNNTISENLNGKTVGILKSIESERLQVERNEKDKFEGNTKEIETNNFKRNCNVYSVHQAKTILSERKKSLPLSNIPKLIGHRVNENGIRSPTSDAIGIDNDIGVNKDFTARAIGKISRGIGKLLRRSNSVKISEPDPVYKVAYLGNVLTGWARGENCIEKPLATLWRNYSQSSKPDVVMKLSITNSGLKGATKEHGLTEYWSHRITYCSSPPHYPKIFCWVYRHEGRKLKHELRCHAVLCTKEPVAQKITEGLQIKLKQALAEFKKDKISKQNARLSLANSVYDNPTMPRRKILLSIGANNYRPPLERSKSAPKLGAIEEMCSEEEEEADDQKCKSSECNNSSSAYSKICTSNRWRTTEKIKSPRKNSLPDSIGEVYRCIDENKIIHSSFSDEVFDLLENKFDSTHSKPSTEINETSRNIITAYPKKVESPRCTLIRITESPEMGELRLPYLVRENKVLEMLGHVNCVTDSDDGSVSSGCETASTVTSCDTEPLSLPPQTQEESVFLKQDVERTKCCSLQMDQRYVSDRQTRSLSSMSDSHFDCEVSNENISEFGTSLGSATERVSYDTGSKDDRRPSEEVNCVPIGEKQFKRRSTYPPLKNLQEVYTNYNNKFDNLIDNMTDYELIASSGENEVFENSSDNVSACSDESGYSELLENGKESSIASTIMV